MIDVSNYGHIADVPLFIHQTTDFVDSEVDLKIMYRFTHFVCININFTMTDFMHFL